VRALLAERLQGRPTRANFRTGHLTICTLVPMRSVPHRVVCLLGLDDGVFPRRTATDGDDLMLAEPYVGDRDSRTEDRQMLLDALMAARDRLIVTYTGNDERTNAPRPPAVPVGELLDVVDRTARVEVGEARDRVVVRHPLQPFDPCNFLPGRLVPARPWSFDRTTLDGARALVGERAPVPPFLRRPLPDADTRLLSVEELVAFVEHPMRAFLRRRLGIRLGDFTDEVDDALAVELDKLAEYGVGQRLLEARLAGVEERQACLAEIARGTLPPGDLGRPVIKTVMPTVEAIVERAQAMLPAGVDPGSVDVRVELPDGRLLTGTVPGVSGDVLRTAMYARVAPKHRLAAWVRLLALSAAHPERPFEAVTVGRAAKGDAASVVRVGALGADAASRHAAAMRELAALVDLHDRCLREPLPVFSKTSAAYAAAVAAGADAEAAAREQWESGYKKRGEDAEPEHELVLGDRRAFDDLLSAPPAPGEDGPGWDAGEPTRFGRCARRLWDPLLAAEATG
jgi:exodeoxyribonuclease V gamma subunit